MPYKPPTHRRGDPIRAADANARTAEIGRLGNLRGGGALTARSGPGGVQLETSTEVEIEARLTAVADADGGYPWEEVIFDGTSWSTTGRIGGNADGGGPPVDPTYERRTGDATLTADGQVYRMIRSPTSGAWLFASRNCPSLEVTINISVVGCNAGGISGATVTVKDADGATISSCTTDGDGTCSIDTNYVGNITVQVTLLTGPTQTQSGTIARGCSRTGSTFTFYFVDQICVQVDGCSGGLEGVDVTLSGAVSATGTTDASGQWCYTPTTNLTGSLTCTVTYLTRDQSSTVTIDATTHVGCSFSFDYVDQLCVCVYNNCNDNLPFSTDLPTVSITVNGNAAGSGTPDGTGKCCITPTYGTIAGDTVVFTAALTGFTTGTQTISAACDLDTCQATINLVVDASGYCCNPFGCLDHPLPLTLTVNDGFGDITITAAEGGELCNWYGCAMRVSAHATHDKDCLTGDFPGEEVPVFLSFGASGLTFAVVPCNGSCWPVTNGDCSTPAGGSCVVPFSDSSALSVTSCDPLDGTASYSGLVAASCVLQWIYGDSFTATVTE